MAYFIKNNLFYKCLFYTDLLVHSNDSKVICKFLFDNDKECALNIAGTFHKSTCNYFYSIFQNH